MREARRTSWLPAALFVAAVLLGCETEVVSVVEISRVDVLPASITLVEGQVETALAFVRESGGSDLTGVPVTWTVDDTLVATVSPQGLVRGRAPGTTWVRASSQGVSGAATVRVIRVDDAGPDSPCQMREQTLAGDLEIPKNVRCVLTSVRVGGHLQMREGSSLVATDLFVASNVEAHEANEIVLTDAVIQGELKFEKGATVTIRDSYFGRKVELKSNWGSITLTDNTIAETLKLEDNRFGPFSLFRNTSQKLECKQNDPLPSGGGNVVGERMTGQCVGL